MEGRRLIALTTGLILAALVVMVWVLPALRRARLPEPVRAHVGIEIDDDGVARVGRVRIAAGQNFRLHAIVEATAEDGSTTLYTQAREVRFLADEQRGAAALDALARADLIQPETTIAVVHPLIRQAIYGEQHPADWPAIVPRRTWLAVDAILSDDGRKTTRPGRAKHLLSMIARCTVQSSSSVPRSWVWKKTVPAASAIKVVATPNTTPIITAATSLFRITVVRLGVARKVAVAVWWWNSFVTIRMPMIITNISPRNWPEV